MVNNFLTKLLASVLHTPSFSEDLNGFFFIWFAGIIDRWELIQAQDLRNKLRMKQKLQQWQQLDSDLSDISAWLDKTEQELEELQKVKLPTSMQALEQKVKKLKVSYGLLRRAISRCWCFLITLFSWDQLAAWMPIAMFLWHKNCSKRTKEGLRQGASVFICRDWQAKVKIFLLPSAFLHSDIDIFTLCCSLLGKPESDCKLAKSTGCKVWGAFFFFFF